MKKHFLIFSIVPLLVFMPFSTTFAQNNQHVNDLQAQINTLLAHIATLQAQLKDVVAAQQEAAPEEKKEFAGETKDILINIQFTRTLRRGATGKDVEDVQTYLALFPDIYPEGLVTGYFGSLTEKAVERFQKKHDIVHSGTPRTTGFGQIGPLTQSKILDLLTLGAGESDVIPPGLSEAPGIQEKLPAPTISDIVVSNITETDATIIWTTDVLVGSSVEYSVNSPVSGGVIAETTEETTTHRINLTGLLAGTTYYFVVVADGDTFNKAESDEQSFTTNVPEVAEVISDIIAHWTFDETEGMTFSDSSGNGSDGVLNNMEASTAWVNGKISGALRFDGIDDYATIPHTDAINVGAVGESYSISFWFNRSGVPKFERFLIGKREGTGGPSPFEFRFDQDSYITFKITDGIKAPFIRPPKTISGNGWNYIVGVRDADTDKIYVYINGEEGNGVDKGLSVFDTTTLSIQNSDPIRINQTLEANRLYYYDLFNIDDVRIYNRALSASEIKTLYDGLK